MNAAKWAKKMGRIMIALSTKIPSETGDIYNNISKLCKSCVKSYLEMNLSNFILFSFDKLQGPKIGFYIPFKSFYETLNDR